MRRKISVLLVPMCLFAVTCFFWSDPAYAAPCPANTHYDFVFSQWNTTSAHGVQAPIQLRKTGVVCTTQGTDGFTAAWIGIQDNNSNDLAQIGFDHHYSTSAANDVYCRFWAIGTGSPHFYDCGLNSGGTYIYFRIQRDPAGGTDYLYFIQDCGQDGYGGCTTKNSSEIAFSSANAVAVGAETDWGTGCTQQIMGTSSLPVNVGTSANPTEFQAAQDGSYGTKS